MPIPQQWCILRLWLLLYSTLIGNPMLEVEPTGQCKNYQNANKAIADAASQAFARLLHHRYAPSNCHLQEAYRFAMHYLVLCMTICHPLQPSMKIF